MGSRLLYRVLPLALCVGVLALLRVSGIGLAGIGPHSATIAVGFLLVGAFIGGKAAAKVGLPRITGYLMVGVLVGPHVTGLLTSDMLAASKTVEGIAVALIALTAGGEIKLAWVRKEAKRLTFITLSELFLVSAGVAALVFFGRSLFPFMPQDDLTHAAVVVLVFTAVAVSASPTVTIAVIAENQADGPVARTVLGVTILKDVVIIILFAIAMTVAKDTLHPGSGGDLGLTLTRELGGSVLVGIAIGIGVATFLRRVDRDTPVFILAISYSISQLATALHMESLLIALTAGFWVENFSSAKGEQLIRGIERLSLPVYALFFAAAGAKVDLDAVALLWPLMLLVAGTRALGVFGGTRLGAILSDAEPAVRRYAWLGLVSQAGVTLALASIVARSFPGWGEEIQVLVIAMIALHEVVGPIGFQYALRKSGEVGAAVGAPAERSAA